jgi:hypothetical protein
MPETIEKLTVPQLHLLRSLSSRSFETTLVPIFLRRCGATEAEWEALRGAGYVRDRKGMTILTEAGRKAYRKGKVGRYF